MLLLLLFSFFVPLLPLFPFFLFHLCPKSAALTADAGCHEGLGELNSSKYLFPCSRYAHCFPFFSYLLSLPSLLSLLCPLSLLSASPASSTSYFAYTLLHFLLSRSSTRFLFFFPPSSASPLLLPGFPSVYANAEDQPAYAGWESEGAAQIKRAPIFEVDSIKNDAILGDFLQKWKLECRADGRFATSPLHLSEVLRRPDHTKCCACHTKSSYQTWRSDASKCNPSREISARTSWHLWWTCLLYCACHAKFILADPLQMSHACQRFWIAAKPPRFAHFWQGAQSLAPATQNGIWTSKGAPYPSVFYTFDFEMCFAPQWRTLFRRLNFQECSEHVGYLRTLTSKCASRHNGVQLFFSHLARWLRTRRFSDPTFRPSGVTNHWQNTVFRDFSTFFARLHLLSSHSFSSLIFLLLFSSLLFPPLLFHLCILSEVWLPNFLRTVLNHDGDDWLTHIVWWPSFLNWEPN